MKNIFVITLFFIGSVSLHGQWYQVNSNTTENLYDIIFLDSLTGYCVGGSYNTNSNTFSSDILKTFDGGENWLNIFSSDSILIESIAIIEESNSIKLYAYASKNSMSYLVSTFLDTTVQTWSIASINYKPISPKVYDNKIFFVDKNDNQLKHLNNDSLIILKDDISIFDVNENGLLMVSENADKIYYSFDFGNIIDTLSAHPNNFGENQLSGAKVFLSNDYYMIYGTYPEGIIISFDNGDNWQYNPTYYDFPYVFHESNIVAFKNNVIFKSDYYDSFRDTLTLINMQPSRFYFHNKIGFLIGQNGVIYKTNNEINVGIKETKTKKNIKVFPNPIKDFLQFEKSNEINVLKIVLINIEGKVIKTLIKPTNSIAIQDIPLGLYFIRIETDKGITVEKVILE